MADLPLTRTDVLKQAWPLVFANAALPLAAVADTFVLSLAGDTADLGGVALGGAIFNVFYWSFYFLRMGTTGLTAQADGAAQAAETQRILLRALGLAALFGSAAWLLRDLIALAGLAVLQGEADVEAKGRDYLVARLWGAPAALGTFALAGWLIGLGRNASNLAIYFVMSSVNIGLDLWFVLGLGYGPGGVGAATAIAEWCALLTAAGFALQAVRRRGGWAPGAFSRPALLDRAALKSLFAINANLMIRSWTLIIGVTWFANAGARQGTSALAGNHILMQIVALWAFVLDAFAFVAETEAGRAFGRRSVRAMRHVVRVTGEPLFITAAGLSLITLAFGDDALRAVVADDAAREAAIRYLPWCAAASLLGALAWLMDGIFIGTTSGRMLRNAAIGSVAVYLVADVVLAGLFANHGVWAAYMVFYLARGGFLAAAYPALERRIQSAPTASDSDAKPSA
ncbi:MATE family efflux transporter [Maricaulis sp. CAU 1757]